MALIIADRVKETTITQGTGTISLSGATFGGFQSFSDAIGEGNTTYYCIQNESNFEIGIGTFSSGTLSRDTVIKSSNSDNKISIVGVAVVFGVVPSSKLIYKNADGDFVISGDINVDDVNADLVTANSGDFGSILTNGATSSGLLTLKRTNAGNFIHAYVDDANDRTIGLYSDANTSPTWRLGLKTSPSDPTAAPSYGYFYATEGAGGLIGDADNQITIANSAPFVVKHQGVDVITAHYTTGVHLQSNSSSYPALIVNGGAALSADIQQWQDSAGSVLSCVDKNGRIGIKTDDPDYALDVAGNIGLNEYIYHNGDSNTYIRFRGDQIDFNAGGRNFLSLDEASQDECVINTGGNDIDFRVEGENLTHLIFTDAENDKVGIGTSSPSYLLDVVGHDALVRSSGLIVGNSGIVLASHTPSVTTNTLYNDGGTLKFNGSAVGGGGGGDGSATDILANTASGIAISGSLQPQITTNDARASGLIASVSGALQHPVTLNSNLSGVLQPQITTNDTRASGLIASVSGALQHPVTLNSNLSGVLQPQITTNDTRASGLIQSTIDSMSGIIVKEADGSPNVSNVNTIVVSNGTLTDNSNGQVTITTGGGGGGGGDGSATDILANTASGIAISGALQPQITTNDTRASGLIASVSGALQHPVTLNSNLSGVLQPQITTNDTRASGLIASVSGALQHPVTLNSNLSGVFQPQITTNDTRASGLIASVSGALQHPVTLNSNLSGVLQPQITTNDTRASGLIASVSGALQHPVTLNSNLSGVLQPQITTNDTRASGLIASVSGALQHPVTLNSNLSGVLQPQITTNDTRASGLIQNTIDSMSGVIVKEADGSPNVSNVHTIVVTNGTLTDNSNGQVTITTGGGGGGAVSAVANGVDNRVATFSSSDALNGEANLTFDGSTLAVNGAFTATTKSFLIDHPTKEGMKLQYASLEGPENGVYIRGTSGSNIITLPDYWADLVDQSTVTVTLTPIGFYQALYVAEKGKNYIKVGGSKGSYDYVVYGERKDVDKLEVEW